VEENAMNDTSANPIFVALLFVLRCVVPLAVLFGISYLLRKMGLIAVELPEPPDERDDEAVGKLTSTKNTVNQPKNIGAHTNIKKTLKQPRSRSK
jgi:hypothetical protein